MIEMLKMLKSWINSSAGIFSIIATIISILGYINSKKARKYSLFLDKEQIIKNIEEHILASHKLQDKDIFNAVDVKKNIGINVELDLICLALEDLHSSGKIISKDNPQKLRDFRKAKFSFYKLPYRGCMEGIPHHK